MLLEFLYPLHEYVSAFNVFKYITFRAFGASITCLLLSLLLGPAFIRFLGRKQLGQLVRKDGPSSHLSKAGTPTMGGALILSSLFISTLLWADLTNKYIWICLATTFIFGLIGFFDDYLKIKKKNSDGLSAKRKLFFQFLTALIISLVIYSMRETPPFLKFPFFKNLSIHLDYFYIPFAMLVIVGASNAVNLTDGLDGLAVGPTVITSVTFAILVYCAGHVKIAEYLQIPYIPGSGEVVVFLGAMAMACLGFLWFNTYPAQVFMGDIGSLALGSALGVVSVISKNELLLGICGGVFVLEALSVIAQVISFKLTGRRVFRMAPIHHHFELKGWAEPKVIVRFWIISIFLALITLSTLKLR